MPTNINTNSGSEALRIIQSGLEATPGTLVPATARWRGLGTIQDNQQIKYPNEQVGIATGLTRAYIPIKGAKLTLAPIEETFEQGPYLFEGGCKKVQTGAADGAGSGKIYAYPFWYNTVTKPQQSQIGIRTYEGGDDVLFEQMEFGYIETITLDGKGEGAWMMSGTVMGRELISGATNSGSTISFDNAHHILDSASGFTAAAGYSSSMIVRVVGSQLNDGIYTVTAQANGQLTVTETTQTETAGNVISVNQYYSGGPTGLALPNVESILFGNTKMFLDPVSGSIGTTQMYSILAATMQVKTGIIGQPAATGSTMFDHLEFAGVDITMDLTFLMRGEALAEKKNCKSLTPRLIRVQSTGGALTTAGTAYSVKTRNIDLAGMWDKFDSIGAQNGIDIVKGTFHAKYDATAAKYASVTYVNQVTALP